MKKKIILVVVATIAAHLVSLAQLQFQRNATVKPLISEYEIETIEAHSGIDLSLMDGDHNDGLSAGVEEKSISKIKLELLNGKLRVSRRQSVSPEARISVYISMNGTKLRSLRLFGDAFATSRGVLNLHGLEVQVNDLAQVALKTKGRLGVQAPSHHRLYKEENYYSVYSVNQ